VFSSARDDHLETTIRPALARGAVVLCDRFADSTRAYQGVAGGVEPQILNALERVIVGRTRPDLTLIVDIDPTVGLARAKARAGTSDRFEREDEQYHRRLREAFLDIARRDPRRCVVLDGSRPPRDVAAAAWAVVAERVGVMSASAIT
jgi:dTMP kinase